jgi:ankyrin repeat protein
MLWIAVNARQNGLASYLVHQGANVNQQVDREWEFGGETPLHAAARNGDAELIKSLLSFGADPSLRDKWNDTPV